MFVQLKCHFSSSKETFETVLPKTGIHDGVEIAASVQGSKALDNYDFDVEWIITLT